MTPRHIKTRNGEKEILLHVVSGAWCSPNCSGRDVSETLPPKDICAYFNEALGTATLVVDNPQPGDPTSFTGCVRCPECLVREIPFPSVTEINSADECEAATARLEQIWDAHKRPGSPEFEERARLVEMILAYEDEHVKWP